MPDTLSLLEAERRSLLEQFGELGDFRPGSITATTGRCGNPHCHCHRSGEAGHGPNLRLTYKRDGKTITETFPTLAAPRKAEREVAEFHHYQQLSRSFVEVNAQICRQRPVAEEGERTEEEKNGGSHPAGSRAGGRDAPDRLFRGAAAVGEGRLGGPWRWPPERLCSEPGRRW